VPAGKIVSFAETAGNVRGIVNPLPTVGGCEQESVADAMERVRKSISHRNRAVSAADYENLAREALPNIIRCKCFPNTNDKDMKEYGSTALVILDNDYSAESNHFKEIQKTATRYIAERSAPQLAAPKRLYILPPLMIRMHVKLLYTTDGFDFIFGVNNEIEERLARFLNPIHGNFNGNGWEIGVIPTVSQIANCVKGIEHLLIINKLVVSCFASLHRSEERTGRGGNQTKPLYFAGEWRT